MHFVEWFTVPNPAPIPTVAPQALTLRYKRGHGAHEGFTTGQYRVWRDNEVVTQQ